MTFQTNFPLYPTKLPYITVSAKGMSNGLSDIPNDGADFGPDTLLGTSSKGQYGPPYTQTVGIQEAMNYASSVAVYSPAEANYIFPKINLLDGIFEFSTPVICNNPYSNFAYVAVEGSNQWTTDIVYTGTGNAITFADNFSLVDIRNLSMDNPNQTADSMIYWDYSSSGSGSSVVIENINTGQGTSGYFFYLNNILVAVIKNINLPSYHAFYINGLHGYSSYLYLLGQGVWSGTSSTIGNFAIAEISGVNQQIIVNNPIFTLKISSCLATGVEANAQIGSLLIDNSVIGTNGGNGPSLIVNANINYIKLLSNLISGSFISSTNTSTQYTIGYLNIDGLYNNYIVGYFNNTSNVKINALELKNISPGTFSSLPTQSSTNGTTAGTVSMDAVEYRIEYKKYVVTFSGYENDTTTNQTINFPLPFSSYAVITANNTGLTISTTTSGITITSPNSTTTYSGIVIVEGY